jgi:hypothetical protein
MADQAQDGVSSVNDDSFIETGEHPRDAVAIVKVRQSVAGWLLYACVFLAFLCDQRATNCTPRKRCYS